MKKIKIGGKYKFIYPDYGSPDSYPTYTAHSGQIVTVLRQIRMGNKESERQEAMFRVKAKDGWKGAVNESELSSFFPPFNKKQKTKYLKDSSQCPSCGSGKIYGGNWDDENHSQEIICNDCGCEWWDIYTLSDVLVK